MKYNYFENVNTFEELKRQYKELAFKHHPDKGGSVEDMQRINAEYDEIKKFVGISTRQQTARPTQKPKRQTYPTTSEKS